MLPRPNCILLAHCTVQPLELLPLAETVRGHRRGYPRLTYSTLHWLSRAVGDIMKGALREE
jgi:hypothetical protein